MSGQEAVATGRGCVCIFGNGPNTVLESTVSNSELIEFFWPSPSSGERAQSVPFSLLFVCPSKLAEFFHVCLFLCLGQFVSKFTEACPPKVFKMCNIHSGKMPAKRPFWKHSAPNLRPVGVPFVQIHSGNNSKIPRDQQL